MSESLRIYLLGTIRPDRNVHQLTVLSEHRGARAIQHMQLQQADVDEINHQVKNLRTFIEQGTPDFGRKDLQSLGEQLANAALDEDVRSLFDGAVAAGRIMPLELLIEDANLAAWPWEYLFDKASQSFVCENFQPICRGIFSAVRDPEAGPPPPKLRILLAVGVESTGGGATPDTEVKWIREVFDTKLATDAVDLRVVRVGEPQDLHKALVERDYDILHYYGHGDFDPQRDEAYLALQQRSGHQTRFYAEDLAIAVMGRTIRLVFLNACKTGVGSATAGLIRSGMAPALVHKGVPAVVATQFVMPDASAHYLSSMIYNSLALGRRLVEAVREGRQAMKHASGSFVDWGIPVLYSRDASLVLLRRPATDATAWLEKFQYAVNNESPILVLASPSDAAAPSLVVARTTTPAQPKPPRCRVALIDIDSKVAFLPDLAEKVNAAQTYYHFSVAYLPIPSGSVRTDFEGGPQLYLPRVQHGLKNAPSALNVDLACCLTAHYLAGEEDGQKFWNYLAAPLDDDKRVVVISTGALPEFAREAGISFAKAVLCVCLSQIVLAEARWPDVDYHQETVGCLFDFCEKHSDMVVGFKKMAVTHQQCRDKIKDPDQLDAIDALMATDVDETATA